MKHTPRLNEAFTYSVEQAGSSSQGAPNLTLTSHPARYSRHTSLSSPICTKRGKNTWFLSLLPGLNELSHVKAFANCEVSRYTLCEGQRAAGPGLMLLPLTSYLQSDPRSLLPLKLLLKRTECRQFVRRT